MYYFHIYCLNNDTLCTFSLIPIVTLTFFLKLVNSKMLLKFLSVDVKFTLFAKILKNIVYYIKKKLKYVSTYNNNNNNASEGIFTFQFV